MGRRPKPFPDIEFRGLKWPDNMERSESRKTPRYFVEFDSALKAIKIALRKMELSSACITWNIIETAADIARQADNTANPDPGVAVWFHWKDKDRVVACDSWSSTKGNLRTITAVLRAMQTLDEAGCAQILEQAMQSFSLAVPEKDKFEIIHSKAHLNPELEWQEILGLRTDYPTLEEVTRAHKILALKYHPDRVEDDGSQQIISAAYQIAKRVALGLHRQMEPEKYPDPDKMEEQEWVRSEETQPVQDYVIEPDPPEHTVVPDEEQSYRGPWEDHPAPPKKKPAKTKLKKPEPKAAKRAAR